LEETLKLLREANVVTQVMAPDNTTVYGGRLDPEYAADLVKKYPDVFYGVFIGVDPHKGFQAVLDMEKDVKRLGCKGIYLQPMMTGIPIEDERHYPIYAKAVELGIPISVSVSIHQNLRFPLSVQSPAGVDRVMMEFPDLKFVCRHALFPYMWDLQAVLMRHDNTYLEISVIRHKYIHPEWLRMINSIFKERVLYGFGAHFLTPAQNLEEFDALPLKDEVKENILYKTSARLLGIKYD